MSKLPTVLIIGCGSIGERHLRTFQSTGRCHVIACDTRPAILADMAEKYKVETSTDWKTAMASPACTTVVICTPAPYHVPMATEVLKSGRHCLIEKPLALSLEGMDELTAAHQASGRACHVAYVNHSRNEPRAAKAFWTVGCSVPFARPPLPAVKTFPPFAPPIVRSITTIMPKAVVRSRMP